MEVGFSLADDEDIENAEAQDMEDAENDIAKESTTTTATIESTVPPPEKTDLFLLKMYLTLPQDKSRKITDELLQSLVFHRPTSHGKQRNPPLSCRFSSKDWKQATSVLYDFIIGSYDDQGTIKSSYKLKANDIKKNSNYLNLKQTKTKAVRQVEGGEAIALEVGFSLADDEGIENAEAQDMEDSNNDVENQQSYAGIFSRNEEKERYQERRHEKKEEKSRLKISEYLTDSSQVQLSRCNVAKQQLMKAASKFLDSTYIPDKPNSEVRFTAFVCILQESIMTNPSGGQPKRRGYKRDRSEIITISNSAEDEEYMFQALEHAQDMSCANRPIVRRISREETNDEGSLYEVAKAMIEEDNKPRKRAKSKALSSESIHRHEPLIIQKISATPKKTTRPPNVGSK